MKIPGTKSKEREEDLDDLCEEYNIPQEFLVKSKKNGSKEAYAYIDKPYGWTYLVNKNFTFSGLCDIVNSRDYSDFKMMSMYSHGTSLYLKMGGMASTDHILSILSLFYYNVYKLVTGYCPNNVSSRFYRLIETLEDIFYGYVEQFE